MKKRKIKNRIFVKWKKYLGEFLMLFLAVFLGFLAEDFRELNADWQKGNMYVKSIVKDIKSDKIILEKTIRENNKRKTYLDSLSKLCFTYKKDNKLLELYKYQSIVQLHPHFFIPNELTVSQLKNAGGMRLISKKSSLDAIYKYDLSKNLLSNQQKYYEAYQNKAIDLSLKIFNQNQLIEMGDYLRTRDSLKLVSMNFKLIQNNKKIITEFGNRVSMYSGVVNYYIMLLERTKQQADSLIATFEKDYKLKAKKH